MSEIMCKGCKALGTACGKCSRCYDEAQSELAALRKERDKLLSAQIEKNSEWAALREDLDECDGERHRLRDKLNSVEQRLADAERRNAELIELLKTVPFGLHIGNMFIGDECKCSQCEFVRAVNTALKPTESGASE